MSGIWPGDVRCVVVLSFDIDGVSGAINRGGPEVARLPTLMSEREYGPSVGAPRILDLLDEHGIKASFHIPGYVAETHEALVADINDRGHEVAHHGYMHEPPATLSREREEEVLDKGISIIEGITGERPKGYRSPGWELSEHSLSLLADRGFVYDSSLMGDDAPYEVDADGRQLVEIPIHWELDDVAYFNYAPSLGYRGLLASPDYAYQAWSGIFEGTYHYGRCFVLTMHPYVIGRPGRLRVLDRLVRHIREFPGVEFMRAIDLAEMWARRDRRQGAV